jgi:hypothetical protein
MPSRPCWHRDRTWTALGLKNWYCSSATAVINGLATIMMFVLVDPYLAGLTDDAVSGRVSDDFFRKAIIWMVGSRLAGTLFAQVLLLPSADVIALISRLI